MGERTGRTGMSGVVRHRTVWEIGSLGCFIGDCPSSESLSRHTVASASMYSSKNGSVDLLAGLPKPSESASCPQ